MMTKMDEVMEKRLAQFDRITKQCRELFDEKNREYNDSFRTCGLVGCVCQVIGCGSRLLAMVVQKPDHGQSKREKLIPILMDAFNYSLMSIMCIEDGNYSGEA
jgi:hypothetical protein